MSFQERIGERGKAIINKDDSKEDSKNNLNMVNQNKQINSNKQNAF